MKNRAVSLAIIILLVAMAWISRGNWGPVLDRYTENGPTWKQPAVKTIPIGKSVENAYDNGVSQKLK